MLEIKDRQLYLNKLGMYDGKIDGVEGKKTRDAYLKLQKKYFVRKSDCDGLYGENTDKLLLNARRVQKRCKNFKLEEFKCECNGRYCTGYPSYLDRELLDNLQELRDIHKTPMTITSGMRCQRYNDSLVGSIPNSKHTKGKAVDFYGTLTNTKTKRQKLVKEWLKKKDANYAYSDTPNMGTSVHVDVK